MKQARAVMFQFTFILTSFICGYQNNNAAGLPWQGLIVLTSIAGGMGSILGLGPKILHAA